VELFRKYLETIGINKKYIVILRNTKKYSGNTLIHVEINVLRSAHSLGPSSVMFSCIFTLCFMCIFLVQNIRHRIINRGMPVNGGQKTLARETPTDVEQLQHISTHVEQVTNSTPDAQQIQKLIPNMNTNFEFDA
jgi:hypothetical protein